jgi:hypothetical protein
MEKLGYDWQEFGAAVAAQIQQVEREFGNTDDAGEPIAVDAKLLAAISRAVEANNQLILNQLKQQGVLK